MDDIFNFIPIDPRTALGGQPTEDQLRAAKQGGVDLVINLAPATTVDGVEIDEAGILRELGVEYCHIPVPWTAPDREHYARFAAVMDARAERSALVHCAMNFRVTAFYSVYAMERLGWTVAEADALLDRIWSTNDRIRLDGVWRDFVMQGR